MWSPLAATTSEFPHAAMKQVLGSVEVILVRQAPVEIQ